MSSTSLYAARAQEPQPPLPACARASRGRARLRAFYVDVRNISFLPYGNNALLLSFPFYFTCLIMPLQALFFYFYTFFLALCRLEHVPHCVGRDLGLLSLGLGLGSLGLGCLLCGSHIWRLRAIRKPYYGIMYIVVVCHD